MIMILSMRKILRTNKGQTYIDTGVKILSAVVCGALILGSVFWILKDTVLANVKTKVSDMLNGPDINPLEGVMWEPGVEKVSSTGDLWTMEGNTLTGYKGTLTAGMSLVFPNEVDGMRVLSVKNTLAGDTNDKLFNIFGNISEPTVMSIEISNGIKEIGNYAFNGCSGITGDLILPDSIRKLGDKAFNSCSRLTGSLVLNDNLTSIGIGCFQSCAFTGNIIIPDSVTTMGMYAFNKCAGFTSLKLSNSLKVIEKYTFALCTSLRGDLTIPDSVIRIEDRAFILNAQGGFNGKLKLPKNLEYIGLGAFQYQSFIGELILPDSLTSISDFAFNQCPGFTGPLNLPSGLTYVGRAAFQSDAGFTGPLIIPNGVKEIPPYAFNTCSGLTALTLPANLKIIGMVAFQKCTGFRGILQIPDTVEVIGDFAFNHCSAFSNTELVMPSQMKVYGDSHMFYNFATATCAKVSIAESNPDFKTVDNVLYSKDGSKLLYYPPLKPNTSYTLPEGITYMPELCFSRNRLLQTLTIPNSYEIQVSDFPETCLNAYWGNGLAVGLYVYTGVVNVEAKSDNPRYTSVDGVLYSKDLKSLWYLPVARKGDIVIPDGVERLEYGCIYPMHATTLFIPASVNYIHSTVFAGLNELTNLTITIDANNPYYQVVNKKIVAK